MPISKENKKHYRNIGHNLKPVVTVAGKGLTENVVAELNRALDDHELIKVKLDIADRAVRSELSGELCAQLKAELVQGIGKITLIFRASKTPKLKTSNIR